jgi:hypothetical protein
VVVLVFIVAIFASLLFANNYLSPKATPALTPAQTYVGVTYSGNSLVEAKLLIEKVKHTLTFLSFNRAGLKNTSELTKICNYAISPDCILLFILAQFQPTGNTYLLS